MRGRWRAAGFTCITVLAGVLLSRLGCVGGCDDVLADGLLPRPDTDGVPRVAVLDLGPWPSGKWTPEQRKERCELLAEVAKRALAAGAPAVLLDVHVANDKSQCGRDFPASLRELLQSSGPRLVLPVDVTDDGRLIRPDPKETVRAGGPALGHVVLQESWPDDRVRRVPLECTARTENGPDGFHALGLQAARLVLGAKPEEVRVSEDELILGRLRLPLHPDNSASERGFLRIRYRDLTSKPAEDTLEILQVLRRRKIPLPAVFVGSTTAKEDQHKVPGRAATVSGAEIHANVAATILDGQTAGPAPLWLVVALTALGPVLILVVDSPRRSSLRLFVTVAVGLGLQAFGACLMARLLVEPVLIAPLVATVLSLGLAGLFERYLTGRAELAATEGTMARDQAELARTKEALASDREQLARARGELARAAEELARARMVRPVSPLSPDEHERAMKDRFPLPLAQIYFNLRRQTDPYRRLMLSIGLSEAVIQYAASLVLADATWRAPSREAWQVVVETHKVDRLSFGQWAGILRDLPGRLAGEPFVPELAELLRKDSKIGDKVHAQVSQFVSLRNLKGHNITGEIEAGSQAIVERLEPDVLALIFDRLPFLSEYWLVTVQTPPEEVTNGEVGGQYRVSLECYAGLAAYARDVFVHHAVADELRTQKLYLFDPRRVRFLLLEPFVKRARCAEHKRPEFFFYSKGLLRGKRVSYAGLGEGCNMPPVEVSKDGTLRRAREAWSRGKERASSDPN